MKKKIDEQEEAITLLKEKQKISISGNDLTKWPDLATIDVCRDLGKKIYNSWHN